MKTKKQLPLELDIAGELAELRSLIDKKRTVMESAESAIGKDAKLPDSATDKFFAIQNECRKSKEYNSLIDSEIEVEGRIREKLSPIMEEYLKRDDFEGAKWFVGRSYMELATAGKVLLFRWILIKEDLWKKKKKK